jgi:hypothetical protein
MVSHYSISCLCLTLLLTKLPKFTMVSHYSISCLCFTLLLTLPSYPSSPWFHIIPFLAYALPYCLPYQVTQVHHGFTLFHFLPMPYLTAYPTKLPKFTTVFSVAQSFVFCVVFCIVFRFTASNDPFPFYSFLPRFFGTIIYFFKFCQFIFFGSDLKRLESVFPDLF